MVPVDWSGYTEVWGPEMSSSYVISEAVSSPKQSLFCGLVI